MKCINCLSREAHCRRPRGLEWLFVPLSWPIYCNRCMTPFYGFSPIVIPMAVWDYWQERSERSERS